MKVVRNPQREQWLMDQLRDSFGLGDRDGDLSHMSDLLKPRQAYWQRVWPIAPTNAETLYWLAGRGHEDALGRVAGLLVVTDQRERDRVTYRPDFTLFDVPSEFKTRRANLAEPGQEVIVYENYLDQLRGYAALETQRRLEAGEEPMLAGNLLVLSLLEGRSSDPLKPTEPVLAFYEVEFTLEELQAEHRLLIERRDQFEGALIGWSIEQLAAAVGDRMPLAHPRAHVALPLCKDWMCGKPRKVVDARTHCQECDKDFYAVRYADEHPKTKAGKGHHVTSEVAHWVYEPRCKWYRLCRPWETDVQRGER